MKQRLVLISSGKVVEEFYTNIIPVVGDTISNKSSEFIVTHRRIIYDTQTVEVLLRKIRTK